MLVEPPLQALVEALQEVVFRCSRIYAEALGGRESNEYGLAVPRDFGQCPAEPQPGCSRVPSYLGSPLTSTGGSCSSGTLWQMQLCIGSPLSVSERYLFVRDSERRVMKLFREPTAIWLVNGAGILVMGNRQIYLGANSSCSVGGRFERSFTPLAVGVLACDHGL